MLKGFPRSSLALGFGCGGLLGGRDRERSIRLLETALDNGITYFDTARMYGLGDAEGILGEVIRGRRDKVTVTGKAGILPPRFQRINDLARGVVGRINRVSGLGLTMPEPVEPRFGHFRPEEIRRSVETSLGQLRTDYLDALLLHECGVEHMRSPAIRDLMETLRQEGKIRTWGSAATPEESDGIVRAGICGPVLQVSFDAWQGVSSGGAALKDPFVIVHSVLAGRMNRLLESLNRDEDAARAWRDRVGLSPQDRSGIAQLLLAHAMQRNPHGLVLFSTSNPDNLKVCVQTARESPFAREAIASVEDFLPGEGGG